jgi:hypothetical protein
VRLEGLGKLKNGMVGWRDLHNEELYELYSSPNITRMIKSSRIKLSEHVARMRRRGMPTRFWWEARGKEDTRKTWTMRYVRRYY